MSGERDTELLVVSALGRWECSLCGDAEGELLKMEEAGPVCLRCADLDHLVYLPRGDAALTRRSRQESALSAVVVRWSRGRRRYERQGILVESKALERAEARCLADAEQRERRRVRSAIRRQREDRELVVAMTTAIRRLYPGCPEDRAVEIASHAAERGSGRVGRSAAGRELGAEALDLAVRASARHRDTDYDRLLMAGADRSIARERVADRLETVLERWRSGSRGES